MVDICAAIQNVGPHTAFDSVVALIAGDGVVARAANQGVVADPARNDIGIAIAGQSIAGQAADQVLKIADHIACGIAAGDNSGKQRNVDRNGRSGVAERIVIRAAIQRVSPGTAIDHVIACTAKQRVGNIAAKDGIAERRACDVLNGSAGNEIALRIAANADVG